MALCAAAAAATVLLWLCRATCHGYKATMAVAVLQRIIKISVERGMGR